MSSELRIQLNNIVEEKNAKILPENIKKGVTIYGVEGIIEEGIDTSDATASVLDILSGKTVYARGEKIEGRMPNNGILSYEPSDEKQSIPQGYVVEGSVLPADITKLNEYQLCLNVAKDINGNTQDTSDATATANDILMGKIAYSRGERLIGTSVAVDTTDATAEAHDILKGMTAYVNGKKITGNYEASEGSSSLLGDDFQKVEWIQATGTQWIDTGVCPKNTHHSALLDFVLISSKQGSEQWIFGQWYGNNGWRCGGSTGNYSSSSYTHDSSHGFSYNQAAISQYARIIGMSAQSNITSDYPMLLFAQQENGNARYVEGGLFRLYGCKIWDDGHIIRDFIPCYRKSDGEIGLYDIVNSAFYGNSGTGTFIKGEEVK